MGIIFSMKEMRSTGSAITVVYQRNLQRLLRLAETEGELAVCLPFAADLAAQAGAYHHAVRLLALAQGYPEVVNSWISYLPELVAWPQSLRDKMPLHKFEQAWAQGQNLDLSATVAELLATVGYYTENGMKTALLSRIP